MAKALIKVLMRFRMRRIFLIMILILGLFAAYCFAQMNGGHGGGGMQGGQQEMHPDMGTQHSSQMLSGQMMQTEMMRSMSQMMGRMSELMRKMSQAVEKPGYRARKQDMSLLMNEMSVAMREMSEQIEKDALDNAMMEKMQDRMKTMSKIMDAAQEKNK